MLVHVLDYVRNCGFCFFLLQLLGWVNNCMIAWHACFLTNFLVLDFFFNLFFTFAKSCRQKCWGFKKKIFLTFYVPYDTTMFSFIFIESKRKSSTYRKKMEAEVWLWKKRTELNLKWNQMKYNKENRRYSLYDRQNDGLSKWLQRKEVKRQINDLKFKNCNNRPCLWQINYKWF